MSALKNKFKINWPRDIKVYDKILFGTAFIFAFFFMSHPDLWETANHSYVFLESVFSGNFMDFYEYCAAHNNSYYYINVANYNIVVYIIFGIWELPVFLFNKLLGLALNENFLIYWAKCVSVGFFTGCGYMVKKLCLALDMPDSSAGMAALFFMFNPIAFYSPMVMGQYDTLCLFFTLWALCYYVKNDLTKFSFILGAGLVCKFFPLLVFVPLLLIREKRILHIIKYAVISMWLYIPTTLLFMGRTGNAAAFTSAMIRRIFTVTTDTGMGAPSVFMLVYAVIVFAAFVYVPKNRKQAKYMAVYLPMVIFCLLFNYIYWHPQWLILMIPFVVVTTFMQENKAPWFWLDIVMAAGFFLYCYAHFPNRAGSMLFDGGLFSHITGNRIALASSWQKISYFIDLLPYAFEFMPVMFTGSIMANIIFKLPLGNVTLADKLSDSTVFDRIPLKFYCYLIFGAGFVCMWLLPSIFEALNAFGVI